MNQKSICQGPLCQARQAPNRFAIQGNNLRAQCHQRAHLGHKRLLPALKGEQRKDAAERVV